MLLLLEDDRRPRPECPCFGFSTHAGQLIDQHGNQCALKTGSYAPCQMDHTGVTTDWNICPLRKDLAVQQLVARLRMGVQNVWPGELPSAVSFDDWVETVMASDYPRLTLD